MEDKATCWVVRGEGTRGTKLLKLDVTFILLLVKEKVISILIPYNTPQIIKQVKSSFGAVTRNTHNMYRYIPYIAYIYIYIYISPLWIGHTLRCVCVCVRERERESEREVRGRLWWQGFSGETTSSGQKGVRPNTWSVIYFTR